MIDWFAPEAARRAAAAFVDRDGVINEHIPDGYVLHPNEFRILPGAIETLGRLSSRDRSLVVITNQSCVNRGLLDRPTLDAIMAAMLRAFEDAGVACAGWVCCPHRPDEGCACRKPGSAMFERAAEATGVNLSRSIMIGDSPTDIEAAERAGVMGILVRRNDPLALSDAVDRVLSGVT